jgi:hypothetical protein
VNRQDLASEQETSQLKGFTTKASLPRRRKPAVLSPGEQIAERSDFRTAEQFPARRLARADLSALQLNADRSGPQQFRKALQKRFTPSRRKPKRVENH